MSIAIRRAVGFNMTFAEIRDIYFIRWRYGHICSDMPIITYAESQVQFIYSRFIFRLFADNII